MAVADTLSLNSNCKSKDEQIVLKVDQAVKEKVSSGKSTRSKKRNAKGKKTQLDAYFLNLTFVSFCRSD